METQRKLKRGMRFEHARILNLDDLSKPGVFVITRVSQAAIYYRPESGWSSAWSDPESFPKKVKRWLD